MDLFGQRYHKLLRDGPKTVADWFFFLPLAGCALIYGALGRTRESLYRRGVLETYNPPVPTISVGNLAAGGTLKTPVVDHIARILTEAGKKVAVVSRGYGRKRIHIDRVVSRGKGPEISPELAGDEPYLLARRNPSLVVIVARQRRLGIEKAVTRFGVEAVVLDDGFQHLSVARHLDLVLLDSECPCGNGWVLPAGPLREFPTALRRADLYVFTRREKDDVPFPLPGKTLSCRHLLHSWALSLDGDSVSLADLTSLKGAAFAGIADPSRFFRDLEKKGLRPEKRLSFCDHVRYDSRMVKALKNLAKGMDYLITTEKDAVKLQGLQFPVPCYQVPLGVEFREQGELEGIVMNLFENGGKTRIPEKLLEILVCPRCRREVEGNAFSSSLICRHCNLAYPVNEGIPRLVAEDAVPAGSSPKTKE